MNNRSGLNILDNLASGIRRNDPCIAAVLSDEAGNGSTALEIENLNKFVDFYTDNNAAHHKGYTLDMIANEFSGLRRRQRESDATLFRRMCSLTVRKNDTIWGNPLDIKHVFETMFVDTICIVSERTNKDSLIKTDDFESDLWTPTGGASFTYDSRFFGYRGLFFDGTEGEKCVYTKRVPLIGIYTFHFLLKGKCGVIIKRGDGKYYDAREQRYESDTCLEWLDTEIINIYDSKDWEDRHALIIIPEITEEITFEFVCIEGNTACIDYPRLFLKPIHPSYTITMQYTGYAIHDKSLHLGEYNDDPNPDVNYVKESYLDHAFIIGPNSVTLSNAFYYILEIVRPQGIQVFCEVLAKEIIDADEGIV